MRSLILAMVLILAGTGMATARCSDDAAALKARIDHDIKVRPSPQVTAAAKEMRKFDAPGPPMDEVDCYNTLARARHALNAPPPTAAAER